MNTRPGSSPRPGVAILVPAVAVLAAVAIACTAGGKPPAPGASRELRSTHAPVVSRSHALRPNVVLIVTDDQRWDSLWAMPHVRELLAGHGVTFTNAFVTTSYCCPSRASILTGQYSRHTGVLSDSPPDGGAPAFRDGSTLATWLRTGGYDTALVGKYLNAYLPPAHVVPPGWNQWDAIEDVRPGVHYYDYTLDQDGSAVEYGTAPSDYSTTVLSNLADRFVAHAKAPFFLYFAPSAPHAPATAAPGDRPLRLPPSTPPSFDERDVSDKPWGTRVPAISPKRARDLDRLRRRMLTSLVAVDRAVASLVGALSARGALNDTVIVFTSDNGYLWGEHRLVRKIWPYEESIRVPLVVRTPWAARARTDSHLVLNIDLAPTIAQLARVAPGLRVDGRSLVPLLEGPPPPSWRRSFVVEYLGHEYAPPGPPTFEAIRTERYLYVEYANGWRELYDLLHDPSELSNLAGTPEAAAVQASVAGQLRALLR